MREVLFGFFFLILNKQKLNYKISGHGIRHKGLVMIIKSKWLMTPELDFFFLIIVLRRMVVVVSCVLTLAPARGTPYLIKRLR